MPSQRRVKFFFLAVLLIVMVAMYYTSAARQTRDSSFYTQTEAALRQKADDVAAEARAAADSEAPTKLTPEDKSSMQERLRAAEKAAKNLADEKAQKFEQGVHGENTGEKSVAGRVMIKQSSGDEDKPLGVAYTGGRPDQQREREKDRKPETPEEHEVEVELNAILKKSPIIIFSKSYCPYSKKAKHILLDVYKISPAPYVVELDQHPLGSALQKLLGDNTGRRTVPNVLINGKSIGGGDDIEALHDRNNLIKAVTELGGKRITEARVSNDEA